MRTIETAVAGDCFVFDGEKFRHWCVTPENIIALLREKDALQARIDALMLEYCPDEMTPEQVEEWGRNQRPVSDEEQQAIDATLNAHNAELSRRTDESK